MQSIRQRGYHRLFLDAAAKASDKSAGQQGPQVGILPAASVAAGVPELDDAKKTFQHGLLRCPFGSREGDTNKRLLV